MGIRICANFRSASLEVETFNLMTTRAEVVVQVYMEVSRNLFSKGEGFGITNLKELSLIDTYLLTFLIRYRSNIADMSYTV